MGMTGSLSDRGGMRDHVTGAAGAGGGREQSQDCTSEHLITYPENDIFLAKTSFCIDTV